MYATGDHPDDVVRTIRSEVSSWTPERGPNWADLQERVEGRPWLVLRTYVFAGVALAAILFIAFLASVQLHVDSLVSPVIAGPLPK